MASRRLFDGAQVEIGSLPITTVSLNKFWIKIAGTWKQAVAFVKISGNWQQIQPKINISGIWR